MQLEAKLKKIESIRFKLWSIHKLQPTAIYNALLELITLHQPQTFIPMMRECIKASKNDPHLGKYIHLFDILLNHYIFNHLLHGCLVEFYSKIVKHLNMQKLWPWVEQAMIVRKYWLRRIHHNLYEDLRVQTYRSTCIDVDNILSREAIQQIRCYYVEKLQLTKQELFYFLPQLHQLYPAYYYTYDHTNHIQDIQGIINKSEVPHKQLLLANQHKVLSLSDVDDTVEPAQVGHRVSQSNAINFITNPFDTNVNNCFYKLPEPRSHHFDFAKRPHTDSEEKCAGQKIEIVSKCRVNVNDQLVYFQKNRVQNKSKGTKENTFQSSPIKEKLQCSPQKQEILLYTPPKHKYLQSPQRQTELQSLKYPTIDQQPKTQSHLKIQSMMNKLHMLNNHECKECGMRFASETSRKQHMEQHIKNKLKQLDLLQARKYGSIIKNPSKLKTAALWINPRAEDQKLPCHIVLPQKQADLHQNYTPSQEDSNSKTRTQEETQIEQQQLIQVQKQQICPLCCLSFEETMVGNQWVIKNAIRINLSPAYNNSTHNPKLMHLQCSKILLQSQKKQSITLP